MKTLIVTILCVVLASAAFFVALERPAWLPDAWAAAAEGRVLIFVVGDERGVQSVREAVDPARILYASDDAVVLAEGRVVATSTSAVSQPLNELGWRDRELEFFHVERADPFGRSAGGGDAESVDPERMAKLRTLVNKPTLTYGEQIFVLQAMNDGIEF